MLRIFFLLFSLFALAAPASATPPDPPLVDGVYSAWTPGYSLNDCANNSANPSIATWQVSTRIVNCVETAVVVAALDVLAGLSNYLGLTVGIMFILAIMFTGVRIMFAEQGFDKKTIAFLLRFGIVAAFSLNMGGWGAVPFAVMREGMELVAGGWTPWLIIDTMLGNLLGFIPGVPLFRGILGMVGPAVFTSASGIMMFGVSLAMMIALLGLVLRSVFNYLQSVVLVGYVVLISPLMIPLAIFQITERYTQKWLQYLIAGMLQPMMLFGFLKVMLVLIDTMIGNIFSAVGCLSAMDDCLKPYWKMDQPLFSWLVPTDPELFEPYGAAGNTKTVAPVQNFINPFAYSTMEVGGPTFPMIDFGAHHTEIMQTVMLNVIALLIIVLIMNSMIKSIPNLADDIAGVISTGIGFEESPMMGQIKKAVSTKTGGASSAAGG